LNGEGKKLQHYHDEVVGKGLCFRSCNGVAV